MRNLFLRRDVFAQTPLLAAAAAMLASSRALAQSQLPEFMKVPASLASER
jgi:hypothetical protein